MWRMGGSGSMCLYKFKSFIASCKMKFDILANTRFTFLPLKIKDIQTRLFAKFYPTVHFQILCLLIFISVFNKDFDTNLLTKISTTESTPYIVSHEQ